MGWLYLRCAKTLSSSVFLGVVQSWSYNVVWYGMVWYGMVWYGMVAKMRVYHNIIITSS